MRVLQFDHIAEEEKLQVLQSFDGTSYAETLTSLKLQVTNQLGRTISPVVRVAGGRPGRRGETLLSGVRVMWGGGFREGFRLGRLNSRLRAGERACVYFLAVPGTTVAQSSGIEFVVEDALHGEDLDTVVLQMHFVHHPEELFLPSYVCRFWPELHNKTYLPVKALPDVRLDGSTLYIGERRLVELVGRTTWDETKIDLYAKETQTSGLIFVIRLWMMWFERDLEIPDQERIEIWLDRDWTEVLNVVSDSHWREVHWNPRCFLPAPIRVNVGIPLPFLDQFHTPCLVTGARGRFRHCVVPLWGNSNKFYRIAHDARRCGGMEHSCLM